MVEMQAGKRGESVVAVQHEQRWTSVVGMIGSCCCYTFAACNAMSELKTAGEPSVVSASSSQLQLFLLWWKVRLVSAAAVVAAAILVWMHLQGCSSKRRTAQQACPH